MTDYEFELPCGHDHLIQQFFDLVEEGVVSCKKCEFTTDQLEDYAKVGNRSANYILGKMYHNGKGREKNLKLAEKHYLESTIFLATDIYIYADLGNLYYFDLDDNVKALEWYTKLNKDIIRFSHSMLDTYYSRYSNELFSLAKIHMLGSHIGLSDKCNVHDALEILKNLVKICPNKDIYWTLGELYRLYLNKHEIDVMEAYQYYKLANCKYSMALVQNSVGSVDKTIELLKQVPNEDEFYSNACQLIGKIYSSYINTNTIKTNHIEAKKWFEKSITSSDYTGYLLIGDLYKNGSADIPKDYIEAGYYYNMFLLMNEDPNKIGLGYDKLSDLYDTLSDRKNSDKYEELKNKSPSSKDYFRKKGRGEKTKIVEESISTNESIFETLVGERTKKRKIIKTT